MKYVITIQAEKTVCLEAQLVVEIPDRLVEDQFKLQRLCEQPIMEFINSNDVAWEEIDDQPPEFSGIDSVEVDDDQDDEVDIRIVYAKDGSVVSEN